MLAGLVVPVALVGLAVDAGAADDGAGWRCPLLHATGVPCPACGATRAFVHLANGDLGFLDYNWAWPALWALGIAWGLLLLTRGWRARPLAGALGARATTLLTQRAWAVVALPFLILLPTWLVAVWNLEHIS
ncbi:MAG: DUF2752 domain-containing protein [Solirubrobacteraceae bacterium]